MPWERGLFDERQCVYHATTQRTALPSIRDERARAHPLITSINLDARTIQRKTYMINSFFSSVYFFLLS